MIVNIHRIKCFPGILYGSLENIIDTKACRGTRIDLILGCSVIHCSYRAFVSQISRALLLIFILDVVESICSVSFRIMRKLAFNTETYIFHIQ